MSLRQLPDGRDLNRCFKEPFAGEEGAIAEAMLAELQTANPECLLDVHNTSGTGPAFAVTITNDAAHQALASLFTDRLIMTDLRLGALMEYSEQEVPTVTIECGGAQDDHAHQLAYEGLARYASQPDVLSLEKAEWNVAVLRNPIRVELAPDATIEYRLTPSGQADLTFPPDIEHRNFGIVSPDEPLGWVGQKGLHDHHQPGDREERLAKPGRVYFSNFILRVGRKANIQLDHIADLLHHYVALQATAINWSTTPSCAFRLSSVNLKTDTLSCFKTVRGNGPEPLGLGAPATVSRATTL